MGLVLLPVNEYFQEKFIEAGTKLPVNIED